MERISSMHSAIETYKGWGSSMAENVYLVFRNNSLHSVWLNVQYYIYLIEAALTDKSILFSYCFLTLRNKCNWMN